jgi:hypothetical protein
MWGTHVLRHMQTTPSIFALARTRRLSPFMQTMQAVFTLILPPILGAESVGSLVPDFF